jgi:hypothetical protein
MVMASHQSAPAHRQMFQAQKKIADFSEVRGHDLARPGDLPSYCVPPTPLPRFTESSPRLSTRRGREYAANAPISDGWRLS